MLEYDYQLNLKNSMKINVSIDTLLEELTEFYTTLTIYNVDFEMMNLIFKQVKIKKITSFIFIIKIYLLIYKAISFYKRNHIQ